MSFMLLSLYKNLLERNMLCNDNFSDNAFCKWKIVQDA